MNIKDSMSLYPVHLCHFFLLSFPIDKTGKKQKEGTFVKKIQGLWCKKMDFGTKHTLWYKTHILVQNTHIGTKTQGSVSNFEDWYDDFIPSYTNEED